MKEPLKTELIKLLFAAIIGIIGTLMVQMSLQLFPFYKIFKKAVSKDLLALTVVIFCLLFIIILIAYLHIISKKLKYGIYWDKQKNPYCPACRTPINRLFPKAIRGRTIYYGTCLKCNKSLQLNREADKFENVTDLIDSL